MQHLYNDRLGTYLLCSPLQFREVSQGHAHGNGKRPASYKCDMVMGIGIGKSSVSHWLTVQLHVTSVTSYH